MVDLTKYTGIIREGKTIRYEGRFNTYEFPTEIEAKIFESLYNSLAVEALEEMMGLIKKHNVVRDAEKLSEKDLASYASRYFRGGGIQGIRAPTQDSIEKRTKQLLELRKDIGLLKELGLL